ncbi:family 43 glycosylhydrolase [Streptomyces albicerus]|uniref:family 43 glycosylhydrolase n=1 Tax=Streptomyces albicerus TaxID=2569859 RepID=UPI001CEC0B07|nr:family 43 glycosylhydrolase [Streptomyces albicerus]
MALGLNSAAASAAAAEGARLVLDRDFPDPDVVKAGDTYHAFATNADGKNIQHATSTDLVRWSVADADALPAVGSWAIPERTLVWAPEVFDNGAGFT